MIIIYLSSTNFIWMKKYLLLFCLLPAFVQAQRVINVDLNKIAGKRSSVFNECVGAGRANEGLRADWQQQLALVQKELNFKYIRFHGLLNDDMRVYWLDKQGKPVFNFQYIDKLYDFLLSVHIRPFVELSFMPADMASGTKTVFWWKGNVTKPKSYELWDDLIRRLVTHLQNRYGKAEIEHWYFEVWNEPDLHGFFDGTQADYFELYSHTARAVKSVSPTYRVGGPATSAIKWIEDFLKYCDQNKVPVDFVSTHDYATTSVLDEFGTKKQKLKPNADSVAQDVEKVRRQVNNSAYKNAELHFTEWNVSPSSRDPMHDSYQSASFILNVLKKAMPHANSLSYWTFTDIFEEAGAGPTPFHGGFGLMNMQDIKKPTYYSYKFLNELGPDELKNSDAASIICRKGKNVQALFWDFTFPTRDFNQVAFAKELPPIDKPPVDLRINHLTNGRYRVEVYKVGYQVNDPYTKYMQWGKPSELSIKQVAELKQVASGKPVSVANVSINNGTFKQRFIMRSNDVYMVKLVKL